MFQKGKGKFKKPRKRWVVFFENNLKKVGGSGWGKNG